MKCPQCKSANTAVRDTRDMVKGRRRRRECKDCAYRFSTTEIYGNLKPDELPLLPCKVHDGANETEDFTSDKLHASITCACRRLDILKEDISQVVDDVAAQAYANGRMQVKAAEIVSWVTSELQKLNTTAACRYWVTYSDGLEKSDKLVSQIKSHL